MKQLRQLEDFTIKEYETYQELITLKEPDIFGIFELFGYDAVDMPYDKFESIWAEIQQMTISKGGVHKTYKFKDVRYSVTLNHLKLKAGQFIDFQQYMQDFNLSKVLSVFLIPQYKKNFMWKTYKYNDGYDIFEVQEHIKNNITIKEASNLTDFFLKSSVKLLQVMRGFSEKRDIKEKKKLLKLQRINLLG